MISKIRYSISRALPRKLTKYLAIRVFPEIVDFTGEVFQGIGNIWDADAEFNQIYDKVKSRILLDKKRAFVLYQITNNCKELDGDFAELGVYKGASSRIIYETSDKRKDIYCFDTFNGIPDFDITKDTFQYKGFLDDVDYEDIKSFLHEKNFKLFKGVFPESALNINKKFSFVHIDVNLYNSTKDGCEYFYDRMTKGGIILFDDYNMTYSDGVKKAVDEFFQDKKETPMILFTGQALVCKQ